MEKGPHKTHCLSCFVQNLIFFVCNPSKLYGPLFQGDILCGIIEEGPRVVQISGLFACNPYKLCGPRFPRGVICVSVWPRVTRF